ncbi:MAG: molybdopterin-dependent oxidoreductase [Acidobacteriota bacterium]|nr:molybdopterin-dependent oxidoreductase [Blastocatellia bacterium]MDW8412938.1 molybdopterin-dependent oxidoreductase [Acidobacteriota bacterium]
MPTYYRACNLCEAICGLEIRVEEGRIVSIRGDVNDKFSRGHICPKAVALQDIQNDPERLRYPVKRVGGNWQQISWDEAFDTVVDKIVAIQRAYGRNSVAIYQGNPTVHNYGSMLYAPEFIRALKTKNRYSATSVDQLPHMLTSYLMFGNQLLLPVPDIDRTDYFLILGANPVVSNGSLMTAPGIAKRLKELRARNGTIVVIDPRRTETAALANKHIFIRPGTDAYLLLAMLHVIFDKQLTRPSPLVTSTDEIQRIVSEYPPERVAKVCGIAAEEIIELAVAFATAPRAVCYGRLGVCTQPFGSLCQWLINLLNILTGNFDREGGAMFTLPAADVIKHVDLFGQRGHFGLWKSRVRGLPESGGELPVATLADEILTPGEGQIKLLITSAGNPVVSAPNSKKLEQALQALEFMVSIDFYINETTKYSHIILPPTAPLEHDHYDLVFYMLSVRNVARFNKALFEPPPEAKHDWEIFYELCTRLEKKTRRRGLVAKLRLAVLRKLGPKGIVAALIRFGPYGAGLNPFSRGLTLRKLEAAEHGVDLGALRPCLKQRLSKIELTPKEYISQLKQLETKLSELEQQEIVLIGRRQLRSNNSWMHRYERLTKRSSCMLLIHPEDAKKIGISDGKLVEVSSRTGSIVLAARISDEIMPGTVSIPHGWSNTNINELTDDLALDSVSGNAAFSGIPVKLCAASQDGLNKHDHLIIDSKTIGTTS